MWQFSKSRMSTFMVLFIIALLAGIFVPVFFGWSTNLTLAFIGAIIFLLLMGFILTEKKIKVADRNKVIIFFIASILFASFAVWFSKDILKLSAFNAKKIVYVIIAVVVVGTFLLQKLRQRRASHK